MLEEKIKEYEKIFTKEKTGNYTLLQGLGKIMVSAPHSVEQTRCGVLKVAEPQTGVLAILLHETTGCPVIYKTGNCNDDANYDTVSPYRQALTDYCKKADIKLLLDLHQLSPLRAEEIDLGTGKGKNLSSKALLDFIKRTFQENGLKNIEVDKLFSATYPYTVSAELSRTCSMQALQIEINSRLVYGEESLQTFKRVFNALQQIIQQGQSFL